MEWVAFFVVVQGKLFGIGLARIAVNDQRTMAYCILQGSIVVKTVKVSHIAFASTNLQVKSGLFVFAALEVELNLPYFQVLETNSFRL
jgi:hypothetical protein